MIHTGSRGLGHQVCSEHVATIESKYQRDGNHWVAQDWDYRLRDRQLAAAPIYSTEGAAYLMRCERLEIMPLQTVPH